MQLCQMHFYQKIERKKVARVNAALQWKKKIQNLIKNSKKKLLRYGFVRL